MTRSARRRAALAGAALWVLGGVGALAAQEGCSFIEGSGNLTNVDFGGNPITYVSTPNLVCRDGVRIRADSAVAYQTSNYVELIGRVRFEDPERRLTAGRAEYFSSVGRLQAHGAVQVEQKNDGGRIRGEEMIYHRSGPGRVRDQLDVFGGRANARLFVRPRPDSAVARPTDTDPAPDTASLPYIVDADRILIEGDDYFRATGRVEVERDRMRAFGDSVEYDQAGGTLRIALEARMIMDERELTADVIQAQLPGDVVSEVIARRRAVLTADDVRLEAPLVHVFFAEGAMERLVAIPTPAEIVVSGALPPPPPEAADTVRPVARAQSFTIVADSLDVRTPAEVLDRIHAAGDARAVSTARDSLNTPDTPDLARTDWMEGDTLVATFARVDATRAEPSDTASAPEDDYRLERLDAVGSARSLYRMISDDSTRTCGDEPVIHYVTGDRILIVMEEGEIQRMEVTGQTQGVHAEPAACTPADTAAAADTVAAGPDARRGTESAPPGVRHALAPPNGDARPELVARRRGARR